MKVAFIGNFAVPWTSETYFTRALEECGCTVDRIQQEEAKDLGPHPFLTRATGCDAVGYTRTHNASALTPAWTSVWEKLKAAGVVTFSVHLDRFWDLEREHLVTGPEPDPLFTAEFVFTADGGPHPWRDHGINHFWLPPGVDRWEVENLRGRFRGHLAADVVFVGSDYAQTSHWDRYPQRHDLIQFLHDRYKSRFVHWGHGSGLGIRRQQDLSDVYVSAQVVVGDSCFANGKPRGVTNSNYWSDRIPETLARGGRLVHPWVDGLRREYPAYVEMHTPGDWDDLANIVDALIAAGPEDRRAAQEFTLADHSWTRRMEYVLRMIGLRAPLDGGIETVQPKEQLL